MAKRQQEPDAQDSQPRAEAPAEDPGLPELLRKQREATDRQAQQSAATLAEQQRLEQRRAGGVTLPPRSSDAVRARERELAEAKRGKTRKGK